MQVTFPHTVAAVGLVEPSSENIAISTPVPGLVMAVHVKVGDRVPRGAPLFALDDRDLRAELTLRQSTLEVARARLARLEHAPRSEELPPAQAKVREAEAALADAHNNQRLMERIPDKRAIREEELLQRREATNMAAARLEAAKASLALAALIVVFYEPLLRDFAYWYASGAQGAFATALPYHLVGEGAIKGVLGGIGHGFTATVQWLAGT